MIRVLPKQERRAPLNLAHLLIHATVIAVCAGCVIPLWLIVAASFTDEKSLALNGYHLIPLKFSTYAYEFLLKEPDILLRAYGISVFVTFVGSAVSLLVMAMLAYVLSRRDFKLARPLSFFIFFTMLFNGGLVPYYILVSRYLHLKNNVLILILPYLVVPFFVLLLRTYFAGLPRELLDAAKIDGAGEWRVFFQIVIPLSTPALATVGLFSLLLYWNDMWQALLFIDDLKLYPLQYLLFRLVQNIMILQDNAVAQGTPTPYQSVRMAMAVFAIGPVVFAFLFVQRYFIRGITLGGLKGE